MRVGGLNQDITYWAPGQTDRFGVQSFAAPVLIKGRWEEKTEQLVTMGGQLINSKAIVLVDRDLQTEGYLALGDFSNDNDPFAVPSASEILTFQDAADLRSVTKVRKVAL